MNIFVTSECPVECAKLLDTKRVIKMTLESAQMLSTALRYHGYIDDKIYKMTHVNHPCNIWCRQTRSNYMWLFKHFLALGDEYMRRRCKVHKSILLLSEIFRENANMIPGGELTTFVNCAENKQLGISYKQHETCTAYRLYLNHKWETDKIKPTWS